MTPFTRRTLVAAMLATTTLTAPAFAQTAAAPATAADDAASDNDIIVTAQKREENVQDVPISIQAIGTRKLDQLNISNFNEYTQLLPSVAFQTSQPGVTTVYMRGVASGGDGNHSGSLPSVGSYLDEQPITTIGGTLDVHIYDIARIESLAGPQGTLYGASSQAGTIRIITNKPDTAGFYGRVDGEVNTVHSGGVGGKLEGMLNLPLSDSAALRVVGFYQRDAGYIDNVPGRRDFLAPPASGGGSEESALTQGAAALPGQPAAAVITRPDGGISVTNTEFVRKNYNINETWGGRAALKVDLDDTWTVTPTVMYQEQRSKGIFGYDPSVGDLQVQRFFPESRRERFIQAALTIEGQLGNWDVTYAGAYLDRTTYSSNDYTDYAEAYDSLYSSVGGLAGYFYYQDAAGNTIDPRQKVIGTDHFKKLSQELRVASPQDERFRIVAGAFFQRQSNQIHQDYQIANLGPQVSVNGLPGTLWLTQQYRLDKDYAMFGEASFDILSNLTLTAGGRAFIYDNSLIGFFGFGRNPGGNYTDSPPNGAGSGGTGVIRCFATDGLRLRGYGDDPSSATRVLLPPAVAGGPCTNLAGYAGSRGLVPIDAQGSGFTHRVNLTWKPTDDILLYGTWSRGFRPGGINRRADIPPYAPDYLKNYELGFKTTLLDGHLRFNGAVYQQNWEKFQFGFLGPNSFTVIQNGPDARIRGVELDANYSGGPLTLTASGSYTDAVTTNALCASVECVAGEVPKAPTGTRLPITPRFKVNGTARYSVPFGSAKGYLQLLVAHQSSASSDIRLSTAASLGRLKQYTTGNVALGAEWTSFNIEAFVQNVWDERAQISRFQACGSCDIRSYIVSSTPRTIGVRAGAKF